MMGSGVWAGEFDLETTYADQRQRPGEDRARSAAVRISTPRDEASGNALPAERRHRAAHRAGSHPGAGRDDTIGIVTGVQGIRWYDLTLTGMPCHAGPTPMEGRRDPVQLLPELLPRIYRLATDNGPWGRATLGELISQPGSRNTVPESIKLSIDLRHPDQETLERMHQALQGTGQ